MTPDYAFASLWRVRVAWVYTFPQTPPPQYSNHYPPTPWQAFTMSLVVPPPSTPHFTRAVHLPHPSSKRARVWGVHWHRTGRHLLGCTLSLSLQTSLVFVLPVTSSWYSWHEEIEWLYPRGRLVNHLGLPPYLSYSCPCHACVLVSLKYEATTLLICVHTVCVFLKVWWRSVHNFPDSGTRVHMV